MIMDCEKYVGKCVCGREHTLETKKVVVEYNALANFEQYMEDVGLAGKRRAVVYDTMVYQLTEGKHVKADQEIVLEAKGLHAEDTLIEEMMKQLDNPEVIVAFGAGTIMDFGRYPAYKLGIPFVAIPTASRPTSVRPYSTARRSPRRCARRSLLWLTLTSSRAHRQDSSRAA